MACDLDIHDAAEVTNTAPVDTDLVLMILADKTVVFRQWGLLKAHLIPNDYERKVAPGVAVDQINTGDAGKTLPQFVGFRVRLIRNGLLQTTIATPGGYSYTFNPLTGDFGFTPAAQTDEIFQITAY